MRLTRSRSLFVLFCLLAVAPVSAGLSLRLKGGLQAREDSGEVVQLLALGDEYTLQVVSDDVGGDNISIEGAQNNPSFDLSSGGAPYSSMASINGHTTTSVIYTYYLRPLVVGGYRLGPAKDSTQTSNVVNVRVVEPAKYDQLAGRKGSARQSLRCSLATDAHEVFVGQPFIITMTMEDDGQVYDRGLVPPQFGALKAEPLANPTAEQKIMNGQVRVVTTQQYQVTADAPGTYTIGGAAGQFLVPSDENEWPGMGGLMGSFFGPSGKKRTIQANNTVVQVKPLPLSKGPVDGVGHFKKLSLSVAKTMLELNEPCVLTLSITGIGNFDAMVAPDLLLPEAISLYPSTSAWQPTGKNPGEGTKSFDYVMQIGEAGDHEIPAQKFSYFDVKAGRYMTLESESLKIQVKKAKVVSAPLTEMPAKKGEEKQAAAAGALVPVGESLPVLPWWLVMLLVFVVLLFLFRSALAAYGAAFLEWVGVTSPLKREYVALQALLAQQEVSRVHAFFVELLARLWECDAQIIDGEYVRERAEGLGWDGEKAAQFASYIELCGQAAFAPQSVRESVKTELLGQATSWYQFVVKQTGKGL